METNSALVIPAPAGPATPSNAVENALRDIKAPVEIPNYWPWFWGATLLILLMAGLILWRRWAKRRPVVPERVVPPHERARKKLEMALARISEPEPFTVLVADTIRVYLEERFDFRAPERTTDEFLYELQNTERLTLDQKQSLGEFLSRCDLIKFARYDPTEDELLELHSAAVRLVNETETVPAAPPVARARKEVGS